MIGFALLMPFRSVPSHFAYAYSLMSVPVSLLPLNLSIIRPSPRSLLIPSQNNSSFYIAIVQFGGQLLTDMTFWGGGGVRRSVVHSIGIFGTHSHGIAHLLYSDLFGAFHSPSSFVSTLFYLFIN